MKKLITIILIAASVLLIGSANVPAPLLAVSDCDESFYVQSLEEYTNGTLTYREQLCRQLGTGNITQTIWFDGINPTTTSATSQEIAAYLFAELASEIDKSEIRLNTEIESGKKAVEILREWSAGAMAINASWDSLTDNQKDSRVKELFRRNAIFWDKYADDLVTRGKGQ